MTKEKLKEPYGSSRNEKYTNWNLDGKNKVGKTFSTIIDTNYKATVNVVLE